MFAFIVTVRKTLGFKIYSYNSHCFPIPQKCISRKWGKLEEIINRKMLSVKSRCYLLNLGSSLKGKMLLI